MIDPTELAKILVAPVLDMSCELGDFTISYDPDDPNCRRLWHGKMAFGTVTIFLARICSANDLPLIGFLYVLQDAKILGPDSETDANYAAYHANESVTQIINRLIYHIQDKYVNMILEDICDRKFDGTYSIQ